jgi:tetraacyldisaccharide 4'-kinase
MSIIKWFLWPFSLIYSSITDIRNLLFDNGIFESKTFDVNVICVGNLSVGGTGKSPMIEYLLNQLKDKYQIAVLSRGYKRQTKGFIEVLPHHDAENVGDEPLQFKRKFPNLTICVDVDRRNGISTLLKTHSKTEIVLLDDAFQHRKVKADFNILLTTYASPFFKDFVLPMGRLRESRSGAKRANAVIVTKCPDKINSVEKQKIKAQIKVYSNHEVGFSTIQYESELINASGKIDFKDFDDFYLITGIANPKPLLKYLSDHKKTFEHLVFPDHYNFTEKDINKFKGLSKPILTTEKDYVRLRNSLDTNLYYQPISICVNDLNLTELINKKLQIS